MSELMADKPFSASVGAYVKAIWELAGPSGGAASTKDVADRLCVSPASVTNMFGRLREMGLVEYEPYRGSSLTDEGRAEALRLVRRHRLMEAFLLEHLGYSWEEVHGEAERLEHAVSDAFTERLDGFLGYPTHDPHGAPIPAADGVLLPEDAYPLGEVEAGDRVVVSRVENRDVPVLAYLGERGLVPGRGLIVRENRVLDGVVTVEHEDGISHALGAALARCIFVQRRSR